MGDTQCSFSLTTFSPLGKLVQIEHALTAVGSGQTSLGIRAANGVVIATEKKLPSILVDETSIDSSAERNPRIEYVILVSQCTALPASLSWLFSNVVLLSSGLR